MSTKLNQLNRRAILDKLLEHRFGAAEKELDEARCKLAHDIYNEKYPLKIVKAMEALPKEAFGAQYSFRVRFGSEYECLHFGCVASKKIHKLFFYEHLQGTAFYYDARDAMTSRYLKIQREHSNLEEIRDSAKADATATLLRATTIEKLLDTWPEITPFVPELTQGSTCVALAIPIEDLNKTFNLPIETQPKPKAKGRARK